ncbi:DUF2255 family protein [Nocardia sp. NPDC005825]|uniref:DUF2255 family protein n=1 Tax=unclassified Nocardia TaxID=2637762 RepID=UPI003406263C
MALTTEQIDELGGADELHISTYRPDGTLRNAIPIWGVRVGDDVYIRAALGPAAVWYRHALADRLHIEAGGAAVDVTLRPTIDAATNAAVDAAYRSKYAGNGSALDTMVTPPAAGTTVRLLAV